MGLMVSIDRALPDTIVLLVLKKLVHQEFIPILANMIGIWLHFLNITESTCKNSHNDDGDKISEFQAILLFSSRKYNLKYSQMST